MSRTRGGALGLLILAAASPVRTARAQDTLRLDALERAAGSADPRARQLALQRAASALRMRNLAAEALPQAGLQAHAIRQSEVTTIPLHLPGADIPQPHADNYEAALAVDETLYDPTVAPRRRAERAQLAENLARVRVSLYALRSQVEASYFDAALLQLQGAELATTADDLAARLAMLRARVRNGTALPGDADAVEAEQLAVEQQRDVVEAERAAELRVLATLTGRRITPADVLVVPAVRADDVAPGDSLGALSRSRPEFERFARTAERLRRAADVASAATQPRVAAFGRAAYGRPGLDFLRTDFHDYWQVGVRLEWRPWDWGSARRTADALDLEARMTATDADAFARDLRDALERSAARIGALRRATTTDSTIVRLRERIEREARRQLEEGVITASQYVDRRDELLRARLSADTRRVQLAQAIAAYRTTLGETTSSGDSAEARE